MGPIWHFFSANWQNMVFTIAQQLNCTCSNNFPGLKNESCACSENQMPWSSGRTSRRSSAHYFFQYSSTHYSHLVEMAGQLYENTAI